MFAGSFCKTLWLNSSINSLPSYPVKMSVKVLIHSGHLELEKIELQLLDLFFSKEQVKLL